MGTCPKKNKNWKPLYGKRMNKVMKVWQVWNRTKSIAGWNVTHTKKKEQIALKLHKKTMKKIWVMSDVFKAERCGSSLLTSNRKNEFERNCWFINEIASKKCCESYRWSVHCKISKQNHLRRWKRDRLVLMAADVWVWEWVYNSTVYNTKGTTWSGSPLWKQAQQEVRQHYFINRFIYKHGTDWLEYAGLVWPSPGA